MSELYHVVNDALTLRLWEIEEPSSTRTWVAARTPDEALMLLLDSIEQGTDDDPAYEALRDSCTVVPLSAEQALSRTYHDECGTSRAMLTEFLTFSQPGVVASSEW